MALEPDPLRCDHCGRDAAETMHTRAGYRVGYYRMHSGDAEPLAVLAEDGKTEEIYMKLLNARSLTTCAECYSDAAVQAERERWFRPERASPGREALRAQGG